MILVRVQDKTIRFCPEHVTSVIGLDQPVSLWATLDLRTLWDGSTYPNRKNRSLVKKVPLSPNTTGYLRNICCQQLGTLTSILNRGGSHMAYLLSSLVWTRLFWKWKICSMSRWRWFLTSKSCRDKRSNQKVILPTAALRWGFPAYSCIHCF